MHDIYLDLLPTQSGWCIIDHMEHNTWIAARTDGATTRAIGKAIGVSHTTISRQVSHNALSSDVVVGVCRAYGHDPVTGLVETGHLQPWEAAAVTVEYALKRATHRQLLTEVESRMDLEADNVFRAANDPNVVRFDRSNNAPANVGDDDILDMPETAVADSGGEDEREGREFD